MALGKEVLDALFVQATQHAALDRPALLIATSQRPVKWPASRTSMVTPPGEERFAWWDLAEPELREKANRFRAGHRVLLLNDDRLDERSALARMAWCLELASQWETSPDLLDFGLFVARAVERTYVGKGPGSECMYQRIPTFRDANAAAAEAIDSVFGPEATFEHFSADDTLPQPFGPPDRPSLARRLVVFGFMHYVDVSSRAFEESTTLDERLTRLDERAPLWWRRLAADKRLVQSYKAVAGLIPDADAIAQADAPIRAWWDLLARIDDHEHHGLAVLQALA
jgi:hypothetical protein